MTPEDEAFDEIARKQGHWGGGYQAKRRMAADKLQETVSFPCCGYTEAIKWNQFNGVVQCHMCGQVYTASPAAQPVQDPVAWVGLTDEEREGIAKDYSLIGYKSPFKEIEAKLKEKNT